MLGAPVKNLFVIRVIEPETKSDITTSPNKFQPAGCTDLFTAFLHSLMDCATFTTYEKS